jgi:hypothetical protein
MAISRARRYAASAALFTASGALAWTEIAHRYGGRINWFFLAVAGAIGAAGFGIARKPIALQILSRATAWCAFLPAAIVAAAQLLFHEAPDRLVMLLAATSGAALLLARPMLHSPEAKAAFEPVRFRRTFLAGATAATSAGFTCTAIGFEMLRYHAVGSGLAVGALATSLLASAFGILRMRGWSVLLGAATSLVTLIVAALMRDSSSLALACAAVPGLILTLPVVASRLGTKESPSRVRVESAVSEEPVARVRIAESAVEIEETVERPRARAQLG